MTPIEERVPDIETERLIDMKHHHSKWKLAESKRGSKIREQRGWNEKRWAVAACCVGEVEVMCLMSSLMSVVSGWVMLSWHTQNFSGSVKICIYGRAAWVFFHYIQARSENCESDEQLTRTNFYREHHIDCIICFYFYFLYVSNFYILIREETCKDKNLTSNKNNLSDLKKITLVFPILPIRWISPKIAARHVCYLCKLWDLPLN